MAEDQPPIANVDPVTGQRLSVTFEELAAPRHPDAQKLLSYWKARSGDFVMGRDVPARAIASLTKNLVVLDIAEGSGFRFRLTGSVLRQRFGRDVTGWLISQVYDATAAASFEQSLYKVLRTKQPVFQAVHVKGILADVHRSETVLLPMKTPEQIDACVLCGVFYHL